MENSFSVHFHGRYAPSQSSKAGIGIVIYDEDGLLYKCSETFTEIPKEEDCTTYFSYKALQKALEELLPNKEYLVQLIHENQLFITDLSKLRKGNDSELLKDASELKQLFREFKNIKFKYIPREQNLEAAALSAKATGVKVKKITYQEFLRNRNQLA